MKKLSQRSEMACSMATPLGEMVVLGPKIKNHDPPNPIPTPLHQDAYL